MSFRTIVNDYLQKIHKDRANPHATPELSLHPHLRDLLKETVAFLSCDFSIISESTKLDIGRPDFIVQDGLLPIGYIEAEAFGTDLDRLTGHAKEQNERFIGNLDNFILTNFVEFRLYTDGELQTKAQLPDAAESRKTQNLTTAHPLESLFDRFLKTRSVYLATPEMLAKYLARRTRELQSQIAAALDNGQSDIYGMFKGFQEVLLFTLTPDDFSDMYAQTLAYGLFAARCALPNGTNFSRLTAADKLPRSNPFLRKLFQQVVLPDFDDSNVTWVLDDIVNLLKNVPQEMLRTAFAVQVPSADPVIHFYETFLKEHDARRRVDRGVYYTRQPIISYVVRSVDALLKIKLGKADGLADDTALILDPATGTGGFLIESVIHIRDYVRNTYGSGYWQQYVNGKVKLKLYKGNVIVAGRQSDDSLFDEDIATFEDDAGAYDQADAGGFIRLNALRLRIAAGKGRK